MAQFDVYLRRNRGRSYMLDMQTDFLSHFDTSLVIPVVAAGPDVAPVTRLDPSVLIDGLPCLLATHLATTVPRHKFGERIASLAEYRDEIITAVDFLVTGV